MNLMLDCSLRELLRQALECHSVHQIMYTIAELERHPDRDYFADECQKLLTKHEEL